MIKWTEEACYLEALNYKSKGEFQKGNKSVYETARKKGWLINYTWFIETKELKKLSKTKWTKETCYQEALNYKSRSEFQKRSNPAYQTARKNGWLEDYTWFKPKKETKSYGYWTKDKCLELAKQCKGKKDFEKKSKRAYAVALKNGWLEDYTWFTNTHIIWNRETCYQEALNYKTRSEFSEKNGSAYAVALKNGWLEDYTWFVEKKKKNGYWDRETCYQEALNYKSRSEFVKCSSGAYNVAYTNGWIKDYTWFEKRAIIEKNIYLVYCYKDDETNSIYIGLTNYLKRRHKQHKYGHKKHGKIEYDSVYKYFNKLGKEVPEPIVLKDNIVAKDAQYYEEYYINFFRKQGINIINVAKAGSLGGLGVWTKEKCYKEALHFTSRRQFEKNKKGAYVAALKNGWLEDYTWFKPKKQTKSKGYWKIRENNETLAKQCKSRNEFSLLNKRAYQVAKEKGWLNEYVWLKPVTSKPSGYYTEDICYQLAKECKSSSEFKRKYPSAYVAARKNGWLKDYTWFERPQKPPKWNRETCYDEAMKYNSRKEFSQGSGKAYETARKNGWLDDYTWFKSLRKKVQ